MVCLKSVSLFGNETPNTSFLVASLNLWTSCRTILSSILERNQLWRVSISPDWIECSQRQDKTSTARSTFSLSHTLRLVSLTLSPTPSLPHTLTQNTIRFTSAIEISKMIYKSDARIENLLLLGSARGLEEPLRGTVFLSTRIEGRSIVRRMSFESRKRAQRTWWQPRCCELLLEGNQTEASIFRRVSKD